MKKRVTVIIALLACLVLAVCLFAACNDGGSTTNRGAFFTVTFDTQGGSAVAPVQVRRGGVLEQPEDPDRPGYIFAGWYLGDGKYDFGSRVSQDITLTAHWQARKITVRFVADAIAVKEIELDYGGSVAPEDIPAVPEKEGYTGVWDTVDLSGITSSVTVNAVYTFIEREVTFVLNYSGAEDVTMMTENGLIDFVPEREGYVFNGWWYSGGHTDGGYILTRRHDMADVITEDGVTLYAEWVKEKEYASQLSAPSVSIDGSRFSWQEIEGATGYEVSVNTTPEESVVTVTDTYFDFPYYYDAGDYTVRIRARGDGTSTRNSAWTSKQYAHKILAAPTRIEINDTTSVLTWNGVMNASDYEIYVNGELKDTVSLPHYDMSGYDAGEYRVRITAKCSGWISTSASADIMKARLKAPEVTVADTYDGYLLTWNAVVNADTYIVTIGEEEFRTGELSFTVSCGDDGLWQDLDALTVTVAAFDSGTDYLISLDAAENELIRKYPLTLSYGEGYVSGNGWFRVGEEVTVEAYAPDYLAPETSAIWLGWFDGDDARLDDGRQTYTFAMPAEDTVYTAEWGFFDVACSSAAAGTAAADKRVYNAGAAATVSASTNPGYTFVGWYDGDEKLTDSLTYDFAMPSESATYTAKWIKVTVVSEDTDKGRVTSLTGTYFPGDKAAVTASTNPGYTFVGWYDGGEKLTDSLTYDFAMPSESATYTAKWIKVTVVSEDTGKGTVTPLTGTYFPGDNVTVTASTNLGYTFTGWYDGDEKLTDSPVYGFEMPSENVTYTARWETRAEMLPFTFVSTAASLTITGVNDGAPQELEIPDYVTGIGQYAFRGCDAVIVWDGDPSVKEIGESAFESYAGRSFVIPDSVSDIGSRAFYNCAGLASVYIGAGVNNIASDAFIGCTALESVSNASALPISAGSTAYGFVGCYAPQIFNYRDGEWKTDTEDGFVFVYDGRAGRLEEYNGNAGELVLPDSFAAYGGQTVTQYRIMPSVFADMTLTSVTIGTGVTSVGSGAFENCTRLTEVHISDLGVWCAIDFDDESANPLSVAGALYLNGNRVTELVIPENVTKIGNYAFYGCEWVGDLTIPAAVKQIGKYAFGGCGNVDEVTFENTTGWYYALSSTATSGTSLSSISLDDSLTAAQWLTSDYSRYYWKRGV